MDQQVLCLYWNWKKSPGSHKLVPYTNSAEVHWISSLRAVRIPRRTSGRDSTQRMGLVWDLRAGLSWQCSLSMNLFAIGWYAVVWIHLDPSSSISCVQRADSNWDPRSVVTVEGTPNLKIHPLTKACASYRLCCLICLRLGWLLASGWIDHCK